MGPKLILEKVLACRKYINLKGFVSKPKINGKISFNLSFLDFGYHAHIVAQTLPQKVVEIFLVLFYRPFM